MRRCFDKGVFIFQWKLASARSAPWVFFWSYSWVGLREEEGTMRRWNLLRSCYQSCDVSGSGTIPEIPLYCTQRWDTHKSSINTRACPGGAAWIGEKSGGEGQIEQITEREWWKIAGTDPRCPSRYTTYRRLTGAFPLCLFTPQIVQFLPLWSVGRTRRHFY